MLVYLQMIETPEDQSKFEILYYKYREWMHSAALKVLHHEQDAEDAVHQSFVKVAENIKKIGDPHSAKTKSYLLTIVENKAIDIYRHKNRHPEVEYSEQNIGFQVEYHGTSVLSRCLANLPSKQRQVITLKFSQGYNNREIARIMNISEFYVMKLEQRGKAKLYELCKMEDLL